MPGVSVSGRVAPWVYRAGVYSSGAMNREFGDFSGDYFTLALLGYDFAKKLSVKEAVLTGNYLYQHPDVDNTFHAAARAHRVDPLEARSREVGACARICRRRRLPGPARSVGHDGDAVLQHHRQAAGRHPLQLPEERWAKRDPSGRLRSARGSGRGDEYNELYVGANYFFYGHKLKVQTGVQWADMNDSANDGGEYSGTSWTTGLRVGW
jgi:phosphate-selective porin OprO/OprP